MFILGFQFPASEGNKIPKEEVIKKLDASVDMSKVKEIKLYEGTNKNNKIELWKTYSKTDTVLAKALVAFYEANKEDKETAYMVYTNKYQMSEISKQVDSDEETVAICRKFDGMDPMHVEVVY